jgi:hypothetical protein
MHKSFQEFFVAQALFEELQDGAVEKWRTPGLYTEVYDFGVKMIDRHGLTPEMINTIVNKGDLAVQGNFLATIYRLAGKSTTVAGLMRDRVRHAPWALVRQVAAQGLGLAFISAENIDCALEIHSKEPNSIIRATASKVLEQFARKAVGTELEKHRHEDVSKALANPVTLQVADAEEILDALGKNNPGIRITYRRALDQPDERWNSVVGAIYLLGVTSDSHIEELIPQVAGRSKNLEVRQAYEEVRAMNTFVPPLPPLPAS